MNIKSLCLHSLSSRVCLAAVFLLPACWAMAQAVRRPAVGRAVPAKTERDVLRIRKLTGLGTRGKIRTPVFRATSSRAAINPPGDWIQITVEYSTTKDWIDELVFQYFVMSETRVDGKRAYSFFKTTVRYGDIKRSTRHFSTVFLKPNTVERYGEPIGIAVEISHAGKVVDKDSGTAASSGLPKGEWWKNPKVTDSQAVTARAGYLLNRSETPFALLDIDDYETIR